MKTTERRNLDDLPYSLHDMYVTAMSAEGERLEFDFAEGYERVPEPVTRVGGSLAFGGVDWDFCFAYTLNFCGNSGVFTGKKQFLADFIRGFRGKTLEIVDETYGYNSTKLAGYLREGKAGRMKECTIEIYHSKPMVYITEE